MLYVAVWYVSIRPVVMRVKEEPRSDITVPSRTYIDTFSFTRSDSNIIQLSLAHNMRNFVYNCVSAQLYYCCVLFITDV